MNALYSALSGLIHDFIFNVRVLSNQGTVCYFDHVMSYVLLETFQIEIDGTTHNHIATIAKEGW